MMQLLLVREGHLVDLASDGWEALEAVKIQTYDLVFMDLQMPLMDGLTATRKIREIERDRERSPVPIVALSANARPQDVTLSLQAGCNAHLSKPISRQRLLAAIEKSKGEARLAYRGELGTLAEEGFYVAPHIFADVAPSASLAQEEIFGPVLAVLKAKILELRRRRNFQLLAIDSWDALELILEFRDRRAETFGFFEWLRDLGVTSLLISEEPALEAVKINHSTRSIAIATLGKPHRASQLIVVRERERGITQLSGPRDQRLGERRAVQERERRVTMQLDIFGRPRRITHHAR